MSIITTIVTNVTKASVVSVSLLMGFLVSAHEDTRPRPVDTGFQVGIVQTELLWHPSPFIEKIMSGIGADTPVPWLRVDLHDTANIDTFLEVLIRAHANKQKVLVMVGPDADDFPNGKAAMTSRYTFHVSRMEMTRFEFRLRKYMDAIAAAGTTIEAFEIGNELESSFFNADIPVGAVNQMTAADLDNWKTAYARFLATAVKVIKDPRYAKAFPGVKVITVGFANSMGYDPGNFIQNPARLLAGLRNLHGVDYLKDVDGYGMHVYPSADTVTKFTEAVFRTYQKAGLTDKPIWITEWGFHKNQFPYKGMTRAQAELQWLTYVKGYTGLTFGPAFLFDYHGDGVPGGDYDIINGDGTLRTDEAAVINHFH